MSLFTALAGILTGMGAFAGPAMALSLNPEAGSPGIEKTNTFHWIIFIVIIIAIVVVNLAILRAVRPRHRHQPMVEGGKSTQLKAGIVLSIVACAVFVTATVFSDQSREVPVSKATVPGMTATVAATPDQKQLEIVATGQQWLWRFNYPNGAFTYHRLVVPAGVTVALKLLATDVVHNWNVPSLTGKADAVPGKSNWVYFRADEEGVHTGRSAILSGQGYDTMEARVEVVSPAAYEAFIAKQKLEIQAAQDLVEETGGAPVADTQPSAVKQDKQNKIMETSESE